MTAQEYLRFTVTLVAVLDPFLAVPIFLTLTAGSSVEGRKRLINAVVLIATGVNGDGHREVDGAQLNLPSSAH